MVKMTRAMVAEEATIANMGDRNCQLNMAKKYTIKISNVAVALILQI